MTLTNYNFNFLWFRDHLMEKNKNFEDLIIVAMLTFLNLSLWLYNCNIPWSKPLVSSHPRYSIISCNLIFIEHLLPTQLSQLYYNGNSLTLLFIEHVSPILASMLLLVILFLKFSSHLIHPIAPLCLWKALSFSSSTRFSSSILIFPIA